MKLSIHHKTIGQIQKEFSALFPYLSIQFFKEKKAINSTTTNFELMNSSHIIIHSSDPNDSFEILGTMTVSELEFLFKTRYNLIIQVFRKSLFTWLETSVTDGWTLNKQNQEGFELSKY